MYNQQLARLTLPQPKKTAAMSETLFCNIYDNFTLLHNRNLRCAASVMMEGFALYSSTSYISWPLSLNTESLSGS